MLREVYVRTRLVHYVVATIYTDLKCCAETKWKPLPVWVLSVCRLLVNARIPAAPLSPL